MHRRDFLKAASAVPLTAGFHPSGGQPQIGRATEDTRAIWIDLVRKVADPVLTNLANGTLKARMPVEQAAGANRQNVTHLEAIGRLAAGIAPWIELSGDGTAEGKIRGEYADLTRRAIARAVDPASPDYLNFTRERQPLVDAAFLAEALLRAPRTLRESLEPATKRNLIAALESTRAIAPGFNNWLLFSATVEAALLKLGASWDRMRVDYALRQHDEWYKGDGAYGDGPQFHWDYYNSFVIHPMLLDVLDACRDEMPAWKELSARVDERAKRYAAVLERLIAPDGSFPAVIRRTLGAPDTFDANGWLRIGLCGHQPAIGETYISTGSLYLCSVAFLPLGLDPADPFWSSPPQPWTSVKAWTGQPFQIDHAI
jgi:hypothetical protein